MKSHTIFLFVTALSFGALHATAGDNEPEPEEFDEFEVYIEINATDGDVGFHGILDGGPWIRASIEDGAGFPLLDVAPELSLQAQGMSEYFFESAEPVFDDFTLEEFLLRFPEGDYEAEGISVDGAQLESETEFSHDIPAAPRVTESTGFDADGNLRIVWERVTDDFRGGPLESSLASYQVVVELTTTFLGEEIELQTEVNVAPDRLEALIPSGFIALAEEFKIEVGAIEETGNRTFTEIEFR